MKPSIKRFTAYLRSLNHASSTINSYTFCIKKYLSKHPQANDYSYKQILLYVGSYVIKKPNRPSVSLVQASLKKYYDFLIQIGYRQLHPCRNLKLFQKRKQMIVQDLFSGHELQQLLKREERYHLLEYRNKLLLSLMIYQGLNCSELKNIKLTHLDIERGTLRIIKGRCSMGRVMNLNSTQLTYCLSYLKHRELIMQQQLGSTCHTHTKALLINKLGNPITSDDLHYTISTCASLYPDRKLTPTTIHQSVIANWLNVLKLPVEQVQLMAGHKNPSTTLRYKQIDIVKYVSFINEFHPI